MRSVDEFITMSSKQALENQETFFRREAKVARIWGSLSTATGLLLTAVIGGEIARNGIQAPFEVMLPLALGQLVFSGYGLYQFGESHMLDQRATLYEAEALHQPDALNH